MGNRVVPPVRGPLFRVAALLPADALLLCDEVLVLAHSLSKGKRTIGFPRLFACKNIDFSKEENHVESPLAAVLVQALVHFHPLGLEVRVAPVPPREFLG